MNTPREIIAAYRWPLALVVTCLIIVFGVLKTMEALLPAGFRKMDVTERFVASFPEVARTTGGALELATVKATESLSRSDERFVAWGLISLGETVTEIRVPVTYRYHLKLSGDWEVRITGNICRVTAPAISPSLPPAIHIAEMERRTIRGWGRFDSGEQMQMLEKRLAEYVVQRAPEYLRFADVREACRQTAGEFVEAWLLRNTDWRADAFHVVEVRFRDEIKSLRKRVKP
jgi:hypothetical protein